ncbi:MAG TPA: methyltransferase domain-containing protein, partial [Humisphaera sp.]
FGKPPFNKPPAGKPAFAKKPSGGPGAFAPRPPAARPVKGPAKNDWVPAVAKPPAGAGPSSPAGPSSGAATDWADVAEWYDSLVGDEGSEYHQKVVFPGVARLLALSPGDAFLDVACGQGALCRLLESKGAVATGIDAAEPLIKAAKDRGPAEITYHVGDVRELERNPAIPAGAFAAAACVLAIQNLNPVNGVFAGAAKALRAGGRFVIVMMHPCFRNPKETHWGWDAEAGTQYRRVDRYLVPRKVPITTHPGSDPGGYTWTFHKPIEAYVRAARGAGLLIDALEEWPSHKTSQPGPRAAAENKAREEIPMFLALRCVKLGA